MFNILILLCLLNSPTICMLIFIFFDRYFADNK